VCRYQVREVLWGNHKRFVVRDTATTTIAVRTTRHIADSDLIRLNMAARGRPDPRTALQRALNESPSELIPDNPSHRQCGRCRQFFASDPTLNPNAIHEWWLCEPCHDKLMGTSRSPIATGSAADRAPSSTASAPPVQLLRGRAWTYHNPRSWGPIPLP
jgi:hypothetical protein